MVSKFCCCIPLEKGCIIISIISLATSGLIFTIHENLWTIMSLALSVISNGFLLTGVIKYTRMSIILYILFEIVHMTEMITSCIMIFVDLIAYQQMKCHGNCHCYWVAIGNWNYDEDHKDSRNACDQEGVILACLFWIYLLADIYFLKTAYSLLMKTHDSKSDDNAVA